VHSALFRGVVGTAVLLLTLASLTGVAFADSAAQSFADGEKLLAKADFEGALKAFAQAAKADRSKPEYMQQYALVNRVVGLRKQLAAEEDAIQWENIARSLHSFYISRGLYEEALPLDEKIHKKLGSAYSAALLAETQLVLDRDADALKVLSELADTKQNANTRALKGLALTRLGKADEAREAAKAIELPADSGPATIYSVARVQAAVGNTDGALALLKRCFESVPPSQLENFKKHAKATREFARISTSSEFSKVFETASKVAESACSAGSNCASCPMRGQCSGGAKQ
jgi:predicted negative regulator of RcsB-dependent stress response